MCGDSRKIHIIKAVLKADDEKILSQFEQVIERAEQPVKKRSANDLVGVWIRRG
jgi:hypothetical protein